VRTKVEFNNNTHSFLKRSNYYHKKVTFHQLRFLVESKFPVSIVYSSNPFARGVSLEFQYRRFQVLCKK